MYGVDFGNRDMWLSIDCEDLNCNALAQDRVRWRQYQTFALHKSRELYESQVCEGRRAEAKVSHVRLFSVLSFKRLDSLKQWSPVQILRALSVSWRPWHIVYGIRYLSRSWVRATLDSSGAFLELRGFVKHLKTSWSVMGFDSRSVGTGTRTHVLRASNKQRQEFCRVLGAMFCRPRPAFFCWLKQDKVLIVFHFIANTH
jgi:hypothetical protein